MQNYFLSFTILLLLTKTYSYSTERPGTEQSILETLAAQIDQSIDEEKTLRQKRSALQKQQQSNMQRQYQLMRQIAPFFCISMPAKGLPIPPRKINKLNEKINAYLDNKNQPEHAWRPASEQRSLDLLLGKIKVTGHRFCLIQTHENMITQRIRTNFDERCKLGQRIAPLLGIQVAQTCRPSPAELRLLDNKYHRYQNRIRR